MIPERSDESQTEYWLSVISILIGEYDFDSNDALNSVREYRERMQSVGALYVVYHWEPSDTAKAVAGRGYRTAPEDIPGRIAAGLV